MNFMSVRRQYIRLSLIALLVFGTSVPTVLAGTPTAQLRATIEHVMGVFRTIRSAEEVAAKKGLLRQIIMPRFDFAEMARRSLGSRWQDLNGREAEFVSVFTQFIETSYLGTLGSYRGEKIVYDREQVDRGYAEVDTRVVGGRGGPMDVRYKLHLVGTEWKVYDVVIDQVSLVSNYRSQFRRVLQTASLEELLRKLHEKGSDDQS
jgi:phospholipid transport system substrate-binding protein